MSTSLQNILKMSSRLLEDVFKASWKRFEDVLPRRLEDVWTRRLYWSRSRHFEDVLKTSPEDVWVRRIYSFWSIRLEDAFWRRRQKTSSGHLQDVFIKTYISWENKLLSYMIRLKFKTVTANQRVKDWSLKRVSDCKIKTIVSKDYASKSTLNECLKLLYQDEFCL